jgi:hypothetical protein
LIPHRSLTRCLDGKKSDTHHVEANWVADRFRRHDYDEGRVDMSLRWIFGILIFVIGLAALKTEIPRLIFGGGGFTKSVDVRSAGQARATYYRLKVGLTYKGEALDFDIVVGCHVRITMYKDNDRTVEVGIAPMAFGLKMKDGRGVVVRPPEACQGETTENGKVPVALLPLVVTYENADQPWLGLAYATEDAYASPISELKFFGASISKATFEEWQRWRRAEAPKNFITYELLGLNAADIWKLPVWKPGYRVMASDCLGYSWLKLPQPLRDAIRPHRPLGKPTYWYPDGAANKALRDVLGSDYQNPFLIEGSRFRDYETNPIGGSGLARRQPNAVVGSHKPPPGSADFNDHPVSGDLYPARTDLSLDRLDDGGELLPEIKAKPQLSWSEVQVKPELRGFAYCERTVFSIASLPDQLFKNGYRYLNKINGETVEQQVVSTSEGTAFERDEYAIFPHTYQIGSIFGGL